MKKRMWRHGSLLVLLLTVLTVTGCSGGSKTEPEPEVEEPVYTVSIGDTQIRVGETKVQALLDAGMNVTWSEMTSDNQIQEYTVDPEMELEANSYYTGGSVWITESTFAHVSFATEDESVKLGDAVIARMEFNLSFREEDKEAQAEIAFDGVPVTEMTREKAGELYPDFTGDEVMWFSTGLKNYDYGLYFDSSSGGLMKFSAEYRYDVDWSGGN